MLCPMLVATTRAVPPCLRSFRIPDLAGFVDLLVRQANVSCRNLLLAGKKVLVCLRRYLSPLLRRIVFVGQAALRLALDQQGVGLCAVRPD